MVTNKPCPCETCILYCKCTSTIQISESYLYTHIVPFCRTIRRYLWIVEYTRYSFHYGGFRKEPSIQSEYRGRYFRFLNMLKHPTT
jgi:hypothetical protein